MGAGSGKSVLANECYTISLVELYLLIFPIVVPAEKETQQFRTITENKKTKRRKRESFAAVSVVCDQVAQ